MCNAKAGMRMDNSSKPQTRAMPTEPALFELKEGDLNAAEQLNYCTASTTVAIK